jgi:hypothetical protein
MIMNLPRTELGSTVWSDNRIMQYHEVQSRSRAISVEQPNQRTVRATLTILSIHHTQLAMLTSHWALPLPWRSLSKKEETIQLNTVQ